MASPLGIALPPPRPRLLPRVRGRAGEGRRCVSLWRTLEEVGARGVASALRAGQLPELEADEPFTLFAPLADFPPELLEQPRGLERVLGFHVVRGATLRSHELGRRVTSSIGQRLEVHLTPHGQLSIGGAAIVGPDLPVGPGVVHLIDRVMFPAELDVLELLHISDNFRRLVTMCELLGFEQRLRGVEPVTLLAPRGLVALPTWQWHAWLHPRGRVHLRRLLERHLVLGRHYLDEVSTLRNLAGERLVVDRAPEGLRVDDRRVLIPNLDTRNGLIHVLEGLS